MQYKLCADARVTRVLHSGEKEQLFLCMAFSRPWFSLIVSAFSGTGKVKISGLFPLIFFTATKSWMEIGRDTLKCFLAHPVRRRQVLLLYCQAEKQKPKSSSQKTKFCQQSRGIFSLNRGYFESKEKIISLRSPTSGEKMSAPPRMAVQRKMKKRGSARGNVD